MLSLLTAAALAAAPAPNFVSKPSADAPKTQAPCDMPCCKDKPMPCCERMHGEKKAETPAEGHGAHEHEH